MRCHEYNLLTSNERQITSVKKSFSSGVITIQPSEKQLGKLLKTLCLSLRV